MLTPYLRVNTAAATYVSLSGSYSNPSWLTAIDAAKITSGSIPVGRYGTGTIPTASINASSPGKERFYHMMRAG